MPFTVTVPVPLTSATVNTDGAAAEDPNCRVPLVVLLCRIAEVVPELVEITKLFPTVPIPTRRVPETSTAFAHKSFSVKLAPGNEIPPCTVKPAVALIGPIAVRVPVVTPFILVSFRTNSDPVIVLFVTVKEPPVTERPLPTPIDPVVEREPAFSKPAIDAVLPEISPVVLRDPTAAALATEKFPAGTVNPCCAVTSPEAVRPSVDVEPFVTARFPPVTEIPPVAV
jgi:hypothetical protein